MIHLHTLGLLGLEGPDGAEIRPLLAQRKRMALLVHLAMSPGGFRSRDALLGLLWTDRDEARGRNALNQALYQLRRALGTGVVVSRGPDVGIVAGALRCDAVEFRAAAEEGRWEEALGLYRGDLLEGFYVDEAPEWERWLERERGRLRELAFAAAWQVADAAADRGDAPAAAAAARRATEISPDQESAYCRRMGLLDRLGERGQALRVYDELRALLREEYDAAPSTEAEALAREIRQALRAAAAPAEHPDPPARAGGQTVRVATPEPAAPARAEGSPRPPPGAPIRVSRRRLLLRGAALAGLVVGAAALGRGLPPRAAPAAEAPADPARVAVFPFRVGGAVPELAYLREGMVDLLSASLADGTRLRSVDPRTVLRAWSAAGGHGAELPPDSLRTLARRLGAGGIVIGEVTGAPGRLVVSLHLLDAARGGVRAGVRVEGPADSLTALVDRAAARLLLDAAGAGSYAPRLSGTPLPAVRAYLQGQRAYRDGHYPEAVRAFEAALEADSTFAPAALGLVGAALWMTEGLDHDAVRRRAWRLRGRLPAADAAYLRALLGPRYPAPAPVAERVGAWEAALVADPGRAEAWYELGDLLFHWGGVAGVDAAGRRARSAFERAAALDAAYAAPRSHLVEAALRDGRVADGRRRIADYLARDSSGEVADYIRWRGAVLDRGAPALDDPGRLGGLGLLRVANMSQLDGVALADGERALEALRARTDDAVTPGAVWSARFLRAMNGGRLREAAALLASGDPEQRAQRAVLDALHWGGDPAAAREALPVLERTARDAPAERATLAACLLGQWRLREGDAAGARAVLPRLRTSAGAAGPFWAPAGHACTVLLEAGAAHLAGRSDARALTDSLERAARALPQEVWFAVPLDLPLARLREEQGDLAGALRAVSSEHAPYDHWSGLHRLSTRLREEGRLAARLGDRPRAIRAWRHYLALHDRPDPVFRETDARVRAELSRLESR